MSEGRSSVQVLLVEDNPGDVRLTQEALKGDIPHELHVAQDGEEALNRLRSGLEGEGAVEPDLVLLDLNLPKLDGREVLEEMKSDESLRTIPVVVLTTSEAEQDVLEMYDRHANCYVTKPVDLDAFLEVVGAIERFWMATASLPNRG